MRKVTMILILFLGLGLGVCFADEGKALDPLWHEIGNYIGILVAGFLVSVVSKVTKELKERHLISQELERSMHLKATAESDRIVAAVEAWALKQGREVNAEEKLAKAVAKLASRYGIDAEKAEEYIEASLVPLGHGAAKALSKLRKEH